MISSVLISLAAVLGAAGVILLALGAHAASAAGLTSAGSILLFHAAAAIATVPSIRQGLVEPRLGTVAAGGLLLGAALFATAVALRELAGYRLFPMAAPTGGTVMIISWLALGVAALAAAARS